MKIKKDIIIEEEFLNIKWDSINFVAVSPVARAQAA